MTAVLDAPSKLATAEEALRWMGEGNWELVDGRKVDTMPGGGKHGNVGSNLHLAVAAFVKQHRLGRVFQAETGVLISRDPDTILAPDLCFVAKHRMSVEPEDVWVETIPDLVAEVCSPWDRPSALHRKMERWMAAGVRLAWEVHPARNSVVVHQLGKAPVELTSADTLEGADVLPGFSMRVSELFE